MVRLLLGFNAAGAGAEGLGAVRAAAMLDVEPNTGPMVLSVLLQHIYPTSGFWRAAHA